MKIVKTVFIAIFLILSNTVYSQNMSVEYVLNFNGSILKYNLLLSDTISLWEHHIDTEDKDKTGLFLVKNIKTKKMLYAEMQLGKTFYVEDSLHPLKWRLTNETKTIMNKQCYGAKSHFRGRDYTAFFTTDFPYSNGPWKYGGLPGLILEIKSDDNTYHYIATKIERNFQVKVLAPSLKNKTFLSWKEYIEEFKILIDKKVQKLKANLAIDDKGSVGHFKFETEEIIYPKAQTGKGIEF